MAQKSTPELYLWLLSGSQHDRVSRISSEKRNNSVGSRLSGRPFPNDPDQLIDALAAICIQNPKSEVFFVSLSVELDSVTLSITSDKEVPIAVISHLYDVRVQLQKLKSILELDPTIPVDSETSPDPNATTPIRTSSVLELQKIIYTFSYRKFRKRFFKRAPGIIENHDNIVKSFLPNDISDRDAKLLMGTHRLLQRIREHLEDGAVTPPFDRALVDLIETIDVLSTAWQGRLKDAGDDSDDSEGVLAKWDNSNYVRENSMLSLRRFLEKLFILHHHIRTIARIACSSRLSRVLDGNFKVLAVPQDHTNISIELSYEDISSIIFPPGYQTSEDSKLAVYNKLLKRVQNRARKQLGTDFEKEAVPEIISMAVNVHAEANLLAYHLQRPYLTPYHYFGGSKLSCHGCSTLFSSFNHVSESFQPGSQFFTKGSHDQIYLRWSLPSLLSATEQHRLHCEDHYESPSLSLDTRVRKEMITVLSAELDGYVHELLRSVTPSVGSSSQSESTTASGDSHEADLDAIEQLLAMGETKRPTRKQS